MYRPIQIPQTNRDERTKEWRKKERMEGEGNKNEKYDMVWCLDAEQSIPKQSIFFFLHFKFIS